MGKKKPPKILATVTDPTGKRIVIAEQVWNNHVLKRHPGMAFQLERVKETLAAPTAIVKDGVEWLYHKPYNLRLPNKFIRAAVRLSRDFGGDGYLASAYEVAEEKDGVKVWPK